MSAAVRLVEETYDAFARRDAAAVLERRRPFDLPVVHVWTVREQRIARLEVYIDVPARRAALGTA